MALLNWGNAFAEAGKSMQTMGLEGVKSVLEQDKIRLADELAGKREETRDIRQEGFKVAGEERSILNAPRLQEAQFPGLEKIEKMKSEVLSETDAKRIKLESETRIAEFKILEPLRRKAIIDQKVAELKALSTPEALTSTRAIALASHIVDPSYSITAAGDGSIRTFDMRSGKVGGQLTDPTTGEVIKVKDPEQMRAATASLTFINTQLGIAQRDHKAELAAIASDVMLSTEDRKTRAAAANAAWELAKQTAAKDAIAPSALLTAKSAAAPAPAAAPKTYSAADLAATVASSGKTEAEVKAAYTAKGMVFK